jgi:hypothetical protein
MAYVVTTFFAMGFGYAVTATSLGRPIRGVWAAWIGFAICLIGTVMAAAAVLAGEASVLYTFYPPLLASAWYYSGAFLLIGGSMIWVVLMIVNMAAWKRDYPDKPVPLAMFAITATALLWAWTASGVLVELLRVLLPSAFGWTTLIDVGLARTLFSVTLHGIVYFWLMPAYIAFYTLLPQAAGGRLYSDTMGRPRARCGIQVPAVILDVLCGATNVADCLLDLRQFGDCRTSSRRPRTPRMDRGAAMGRADGAGRRLIAGDARRRRLRWHHQHELRDEFDDS